VLLSLKAEFKQVTGSDWKPGMSTVEVTPQNGDSGGAALGEQITAQGNKVRELKTSKADKVRQLYSQLESVSHI